MRHSSRKRPEELVTPEPPDAESRASRIPLTKENENSTREASAETSKPPTKKRRIADSPPWKSASSQTPTTLFVEGRRRSGRVNLLATELLPPPLIPSTDGTPSRKTRGPPPRAEESTGSSVGRRTSVSRRPTGTPSNKSLPKKGSQNNRTSATPLKSHDAKRLAVKAPASTNTKNKITPKPMHLTYSGPRRTSARTAAKAAAEASEDYDEPPSRTGNHLSFDSDGEVDIHVNWVPRKIKIRFSRTPHLPIIHPLHIPPVPKYPTFNDFLESEEVISRDDTIDLEEEALIEAETRQQVEQACIDGPLAPENCSVLIPDEQSGPPRQYYHFDQLIAHALNFQKLMEREKRHHMAMAKRLAIACAQKVQESIPKSQEEIEEEQAQAALRAFKELVILGLRNKWTLIVEEVYRRRKERDEEIRQLQGKQQLHQMLEHSTQLLKVRAKRTSVTTMSDLGEGHDEDDGVPEGEDSGDGISVDEDDLVSPQSSDEDNMSVSDIDNDDNDEQDDDANLTVEQLRAKYSGLREDANEPSLLKGATLSAHSSNHADGDSDNSQNDTFELDHEMPELEEVDDLLLESEDDASIVMDSELDENESSHLESEDGGADEGSPGLLGFFGDIEALVKSESSIISDDTHMIDVAEEEVLAVEAVSDHLKYDSDHEQNIMDSEEPTNGLIRTNHESPQEAEQEHSVANKSSTLHELEDHDNSIHAEVDRYSTTSDTAAKNKASLSTTSHTTPQPTSDVKTPIPFLLRGTLREYQHYGLDWLAGLYANKTNGILADEMGLGKTIQTIALIAHLACEKEIWGPHLIVVPTSVMLNWEMEFKKWAPGFKILTYYGSREQRAEKRKGWFDNNLWHVCITSYQLVLQDQVTFKRRNWHYLILDEAHNIKNFRSQRWQTLLNFKAEARLLITGTPLQNNLIELWSLLYFLMPSGASASMPSGFANLKEFQEWFAHPVDQLIEGGREQMDDEARNTVTKLHQVLRPYLLRRLKADVEKQMPAKYEHIVYCRLSKRQRELYDGFMSMSSTRDTFQSGNYLSIINCLMQLRKVCNHPDLFETRQIVTSFAMPRSVVASYEIKELLVRKRFLEQGPFESVNLDLLGVLPALNETSLSTHAAASVASLNDNIGLRREHDTVLSTVSDQQPDFNSVPGNALYEEYQKKLGVLDHLKHCIYLNQLRCEQRPIYGTNLIDACSRGVKIGLIQYGPISRRETVDSYFRYSSAMEAMIITVDQRAALMTPIFDKFACVTPKIVCTDMPQITLTLEGVDLVRRIQHKFRSDPFHSPRVRLSIAFPDKRLLQYDCGKLQRLDTLLRDLQAGGHRALIFTQMTKVLDILEQFLNIHGYRYLRLDGSTKVEQRQVLTDRFNNDNRILVFILSTRSGGLGINLTGADTVIFYDLDWNPAMDKQCQDRCHRIGQTRDVHIYRFVSEYTIESNILRKSNQKRMLDDVVIQEGDFTTDYLNKLTLKDMLGDDLLQQLGTDYLPDKPLAITEPMAKTNGAELEKALEAAEDVEDAIAAKEAQRELDIDGADFGDTANKPRITELPDTEQSAEIEQPRRSERQSTAAVSEHEAASAAEDTTTPANFEAESSEPGHIDDWMIKYMEWEVETLPSLPVSKDSKRRKRERSKKGKMYR